MDEVSLEMWGDDSPDVIRVLHLDDDPEIVRLTELFLGEEHDDFDVLTETNPITAIDQIHSEDVDCIVTDFDMPEMDGLEFLEIIRQDHPDLPCILFTAKGSEEIASEAISSGVTDYLLKRTTRDQYAVLANRIQNAVAQYRAEREVERRSKWYSQVLEHSSDYVMIVDEMGKVSYISPAVERVMGYSQEELIGTDSFENIHPDDLDHASNALARTIENPQQEVTVEFRVEAADGSVRWLEARGRNFLDDPIINGVMVNVRDISERKRREQELQEQKEQLEELTSFLSHDVANQLNVVQGSIELSDSHGTDENLLRALTALERIKQMIDKVRKLAHSDRELSERAAVDLKKAVNTCWNNVTVSNTDAELVVESSISFYADEERLRTLLENLFRNALNHAGADVTLRVGCLEEELGFYVEDDGSGIPPEQREQVFETGYTTSHEGDGLGLAIVQRIISAHDWTITATESEDGGARFEITDVEIVE
jgi:PAS domain S-box-containing protein